MKHKTLAAVVFLALIVAGQESVTAQMYKSRPSAYAHSIEVLYGSNVMSYKIDRALTQGSGVAGGMKGDIRYTGYFLPWLGVYAQFGMSRATENGNNYFANYYEADKHQYLYKAYEINNFKSKNDNMLKKGYGPYSILGLAFRYDVGNFSFRPRVGIGVGAFASSQYSYERFIKDGNSESPIVYYSSMCEKPAEYIFNGETAEVTYTDAFLVMGSLQATYPVNKYFFFSLEAGITCSPTKYDVRDKIYTADPVYNPKNFVEALYMSDSRGKWKIDTEVFEENYRTEKVGTSCYLQIGIGWAFGREHKPNGWTF